MNLKFYCVCMFTFKNSTIKKNAVKILPVKWRLLPFLVPMFLPHCFPGGTHSHSLTVFGKQSCCYAANCQIDSSGVPSWWRGKCFFFPSVNVKMQPNRNLLESPFTCSFVWQFGCVSQFMQRFKSSCRLNQRPYNEGKGAAHAHVRAHAATTGVGSCNFWVFDGCYVFLFVCDFFCFLFQYTSHCKQVSVLVYL